MVKWTDDFFLFFAGLLCQLPGCLLPLKPRVAAFIPSIPKLPLKLIVLSSHPLLPVSPRNLTQLFAYLEKLLQISSFCQPSLDCWPVWEGGREWNSSLEAVGRTENCIQHSDQLMTFNQDYLSGGEVTFNFVLDNGNCEFFPYPVAVFEAKKAGNIGTFHLARALE